MTGRPSEIFRPIVRAEQGYRGKPLLAWERQQEDGFTADSSEMTTAPAESQCTVLAQLPTATLFPLTAPPQEPLKLQAHARLSKLLCRALVTASLDDAESFFHLFSWPLRPMRFGAESVLLSSSLRSRCHPTTLAGSVLFSDPLAATLRKTIPLPRHRASKRSSTPHLTSSTPSHPPALSLNTLLTPAHRWLKALRACQCCL